MAVFSSRALFSFSHWALQVSILLQTSISKQALAKRINFRQFRFAQQLLSQSIADQLNQPTFTKSSPTLFAPFHRVLLQDSTVLKVSAGLATIFRGNQAKGGNTASIRLQHIYELKSERSMAFDLTGYRVNDQAASGPILAWLQAGDLLIRDLGYFALSVFKGIQERGAFYVSRFKPNTHLYALQEDHTIDLLAALHKHGMVDWDCRLGSQEKLAIRLVAVKLPDPIAEQRRRQLCKKSKTDHRKQYSQAYRDLLGWAIFVTNVGRQTWSVHQLLQAYGWRWRIETIFKCWKSHFHLTDVCLKGSMSETMVRVFVFYMLAFITLFWAYAYQYWGDKVYQACGRYLSILKFTDVMMACGGIEDEQFLLAIFCRFGVYDQHRKRTNYMQAVRENLLLPAWKDY